MSRIGKSAIKLPDKVKVELKDGVVKVQGPKGTLEHKVPEGIEVVMSNSDVQVKRKDESRRCRSLHGITRTLIANMVEGVSKGFERKLELNGLGLKAQAQGQNLNLSLGLSHPVKFPLPKGITAKIDGNTKITLSGADKVLLGGIAASIRGLRPPEPYKGSGIKYAEEVIHRKAGKTTGAGGA